MKKVSLLSCLTLVCPIFISGCGGSHMTRTAPPPTPASSDAFRPNFLGDLKQANFWPQHEVRYRFALPGAAKGLGGIPLRNKEITQKQREATVSAFAKWAAASAVPGPEENTRGPRIAFREAGDNEGADVTVVIQSADEFSGNTLGATSWYLPRGQEMGAAVIRVRGDLSDTLFEAVMLHEAGHALGFDGHDQQLWAVMYATTRPVDPVTRLGEREENSVSANYARDATRAAQGAPGGFYEIECH